MVNQHEQPPAATAQANSFCAADDRVEAVLARSREARAENRRRIQAARERVAAARGQRPSGANGKPWPNAQQPTVRAVDLSEQIQRSKMSRARLAELAAVLAETEDNVAYIHDRLAEHDPRRSDRYRRAADNARQVARRAWEIQRHAAG
jgi:hypothetical protein